MKKLLYLSMFFLAIGFSHRAEAQVRVNVNIGIQPQWGPVGYDYARYYYMPEMDVYYDVVNRHYTYYQGNRWVTKSKLPGRYRNYDLYRTYKVVINDRNPWNSHRHHRERYVRYSSNHSQRILRDWDRNDRRFDRDDRNDKRNKHYNKNKKHQGHHDKGRGRN